MRCSNARVRIPDLICTRGFRDIIFIQRMNRKHHYDLSWDKPKLPVHRRDCLEVTERVDYAGHVLQPLDEDEARRVVGTMAERGIDAIAVCFLFSFVRPEHELRMREIIAEVHPKAEVSLSHEVFPRWREYERASTTILDAYLKPLVRGYVANVDDGLRANGIDTHFLMMKSNGGVTDAASVARKPIDLMVSGPVGGVLAAVYLGQLTGRPNLISIDMGGTSFDVSLIADGKRTGRTASSSNGAFRSARRWSTSRRSAPAAARSPGSTKAACCASDRAAPGHSRGRPATGGAAPSRPSPTPTWCSGGSNPDYFLGGEMTLDSRGRAAARRALAERSAMRRRRRPRHHRSRRLGTW